MPVSGTVPHFDVSLTAGEAPVVVTVTGVEADGQATGPTSTETLQAFFKRGITALAVSGILSGVAQAITASELSGIMQFQRELAFRVADMEQYTHPNAPRLTAAQALVPAGTEVQFGT